MYPLCACHSWIDSRTVVSHFYLYNELNEVKAIWYPILKPNSSCFIFTFSLQIYFKLQRIQPTDVCWSQMTEIDDLDWEINRNERYSNLSNCQTRTYQFQCIFKLLLYGRSWNLLKWLVTLFRTQISFQDHTKWRRCRCSYLSRPFIVHAIYIYIMPSFKTMESVF